MIKNYLLKNFADILAINVLLHNKDISGKFIQEKDSGNIWFKESKNSSFYNIFAKNNNETDLPFEEGQPQARSPEIGWSELLNKMTVKSLDNSKLAEEILIITNDKKVLVDIIKKHYLIQMGEVSYSNYLNNDRWIIKVVYPSVWIISLLEQSNQIYNKVTGFNNIYIEKGFEIKERYNIQKNYNLKIPINNYLLIQANGKIESVSVYWKSANKIIEITAETPREVLIKEEIKVQIQPKLVKAYNKKETSLWKVDDLDKLKKIITNYASDHLAGFKAWFTNENNAYILSPNSLNDSGVISLFNDAFGSYSKLKEKVFFPSGYSLMPLLDESRLYEIYGVNNTDYLIFDNNNENILVTVLPEKNINSLASFIAYMVEKNVNEIENFESKWHFDFGELKKKTPIIRIEEIIDENSAAYKNIKVRKGLKKEEIKALNKTRKNIDPSEWEKLKSEIYRIDNLLIDEINNSPLWSERSQISYLFGNKASSIIAKLVSSIIERDNNDFINQIEKYISDNESNDFFNSLNSTDEKSKGKALSNIRTKVASAEINFAYQLYYAKKFKDKDVFDYAVESMRKSYSNSNFKFHDFEEKSFGSTNDDLTIQNKNIENIKTNIEEFTQILNRYDKSLKAVVLKQFKIMLDSNLPFNSDILIDLENLDKKNTDKVLLDINELLNNYPRLPKSPNKSTEKWLSILEMKNMKAIPVKDFFTGELYRSSFSSDFKPEEIAEKVYENYMSNEENWMNELLLNKTELDKAKSQRILLQIITDHSPLKDFRPFITDLVYDNSYYNIIVMNCDIYRISLRYGIKIDEDKFFEKLIKAVTQPFVSFIDFKDAIENIIFCLFISQSSRRREFFNIILDRCLEWYEHLDGNQTFVEELLTSITFLEASILLDDIPDSVTEYNFKARKNSIWTEYAVYLKENYNEFLEN